MKPEWYFKNRSEREKANNAQAVATIQDFFDDELDIFVYPAYGTLLGAVREGDFITEDVDIDMAWHSRGKTREEVLKDVLQVWKTLERHKMFARPGNYAGRCKAKIGDGTAYHGDEDVTNIDLSVSWIEGGTYWTSDFGSLGNVEVAPVKSALRGVSVYVPSGYDEFLTVMYGDWRTPKHEGFRNPDLVWGSYLIQ